MDTNEKQIPTDTYSDLENCNEEKYLKKIHDIFNDIKVPDDFNTWTVHKQFDWKYQNVKKLFPDVPKSLQYMIKANFHQINLHQSQEKLPEWMDINKYRKAHKFVNNHYFSIILNHLLSIAYASTFEDGLKTFILGGTTHTPYLAFQRYLFKSLFFNICK